MERGGRHFAVVGVEPSFVLSGGITEGTTTVPNPPQSSLTLHSPAQSSTTLHNPSTPLHTPLHPSTPLHTPHQPSTTLHNTPQPSTPLHNTPHPSVGRNEPAVPLAAVRLGRLGSGGSARRRWRPADLAGRTSGPNRRAVPTHPPTTPQGSPG